MDDSTKGMLEGLYKAILSENDGYHFYLMAANSTQDPKGKKVFEELAQEELNHMEFLKRQFSSLRKTGKPDKEAKLGTAKGLKKPFPIFSDLLKDRLSNAHFEMSALSIGVQLELLAISFYKLQADRVTDPFVKEFYKELADWESGHYRALLTELDSLKDDYWQAGGFSPF